MTTPDLSLCSLNDLINFSKNKDLDAEESFYNNVETTLQKHLKFLIEQHVPIVVNPLDKPYQILERLLKELKREKNALLAITDQTGELNILKAIPEDILDLEQLLALDKELNRLNMILVMKRLDPVDKKATNVDLHKCELTRVPKELIELLSTYPALTCLILSNNHLTALPDEICAFSALTSLCVGGNQLHSLPCDIGNLRSLTTLIADDNNLNVLPESLHTLNLQWLLVTGNPFVSLPLVLGNLVLIRNNAYVPLSQLPPDAFVWDHLSPIFAPSFCANSELKTKNKVSKEESEKNECEGEKNDTINDTIAEADKKRPKTN